MMPARRNLPRRRHILARTGSALFLLVWFAKELVVSSVRVGIDALSPRPNLHPGIVHMPIGPASDAEIFLLANLITLTPGTLTLDVAADRSYLLIHSIYCTDEAALIDELQSGMGRHVGAVFR